MPFDKNHLVESSLADVVAAAQGAFKQQLISAIVFGSAATGQLRASSDVNLMLVLEQFDADQADALRETIRIARAAINLHVMFLLRSEFETATEAFAVKFLDIAVRHRVLYGQDIFLNFPLLKEPLKNTCSNYC